MKIDNNTVGVSAGACNGLSYMSGQRGRVSSSLPYVTKITYVDGIPMLDGGIADSIPVRYALDQGYEKLVVILTRNKGYRKKEGKVCIAKDIAKVFIENL